MLTCEEIAVQAMARVSELTDTYSKSRTLMYRRIGVRQQQLVLAATEANQDYFGTVATGTVDHASGDRVDLADIADPVPTPEQVQRIEVEATDGNPAAPPIGKEIAVVPIGDVDAEDPPRATLRRQILKGVGTDLLHVDVVRVYYARQPMSYGPTHRNEITEIPTPHDELLVVDLALFLLNGARGIEKDERDRAVAQLASEEAGLLEGFRLHVAHSIPMTSRFVRPPAAPRKEDNDA